MLCFFAFFFLIKMYNSQSDMMPILIWPQTKTKNQLVTVSLLVLSEWQHLLYNDQKVANVVFSNSAVVP